LKVHNRHIAVKLRHSQKLNGQDNFAS